MKFLEKLQGQPELTRKIIFWVTIIALCLIFFVVWIRNFQHKLKDFQKEKFIEELNTPSLGKELGGMPEIEGQKIEEGLGKIQEMAKEGEKETTSTSQQLIVD